MGRYSAHDVYEDGSLLLFRDDSETLFAEFYDKAVMDDVLMAVNSHDALVKALEGIAAMNVTPSRGASIANARCQVSTLTGRLVW